MEHVALKHVIGHDFVESDMLISHKFINQFRKLLILLLEARKLQLCRLLALSKLLKLARSLARRHPLLFIVPVRLIEVIQSFVSDLLTIVTDAKLVRPSANSCHCLIKLLNKALIH